MRITRKTTPADVMESLQIHCSSDYDPTWEDASSYCRMLVAGYENEELDGIATIDLQGLAKDATVTRAKAAKAAMAVIAARSGMKDCIEQDCKNWGQSRFNGRCYFHRPTEMDADGYYIRTYSPMGEPDRDRGCDEMPLGAPR